MDFGKAFSYMFDDPDWFNKIIIPVLFGLIPIVGWLVLLGYTLRTAKNIAEHVERPLPTCEFGLDLGKGFRYFLISLVYAIPSVTLGLLLALLSTSLESNPGYWLAVVGVVLVAVLLIAYVLFLALVMPVVRTNFAVKDTFSSGFAFKEIFGMLGKSIGSWLLVVLGSFLAGLIAPLGLIACGIGVFLTSMYSQLMVAHLEGQAYILSQPDVVVETPAQ
ncbi:MAG: DUF4013 domain-containing protein [Anaerolineaceae bacterium]